MDLAALLNEAINGSISERWEWYRAIAEACPLWTRQQGVYESRLGRQTTEYQSATAWRVMSHNLEHDAASDSSLGLARRQLEHITSLSGPADMTQEAVRRLDKQQYANNIRQIVPAVHAAQRFFEDGARRDELSAVKQRIRGPTKRGPKGSLDPSQISDLVRDAKPWLRAVAQSARQRDKCPAVREILPFLDEAEFEYIWTPEAGKSWRRTATCLMQRRLAAFANGHLSAATIFEYAFGRADAAKFRNEYRQNESNPIQPPAPSYRG